MITDTNTLVWVLIGVIGLLVLVNIVVLVTSRKQKVVEVPATLPPLGYRDMLAADLAAKKEKLIGIRLKAKELEKEYDTLKCEISDLEKMRGDVL